MLLDLLGMAWMMLVTYPLGALWGAALVFTQPLLVLVAMSLAVCVYLIGRWLDRRYGEARFRLRRFATVCFAVAFAFYLVSVGFAYWGCTTGPPDGFCMSPGFPFQFFSAVFLLLGLISLFRAALNEDRQAKG